MKRLLIVRHAKSDWGAANTKDFDRTLNSRGLLNAPEMGKRLISRKLIPQQLVSSPALRAITTCKIIAKEIQYPETEIVQEPKIYEANYQTLLKVVNQFDDKYNSIALFGHNNGITDLAVYLSNADLYNIPTCGMVLIEFPFDSWKIVSQNTGNMVLFDYPKNSFEAF
ncbi:SixA phosphatase family protein [Pedobacter puniceum]|uniref:Histidine phosphatase family protein n=1 Tax=Pedobacter puniceum TaxID=2666136 RepID=A0A7K0FK20_9SPHI|nr:histidine phosphatase family protein [Pedobacter puniceum]MRX46001.1 histidine phosphatase family protein [Pedobacter puniceum]